MAVTIKHAKTDNIADWTQGDLDAQIALGNYPPGTVLADIVLPSDWNNDHTISGTIAITNGGTGQTTANAAINALLPSQAGNSGKVLSTDGTDTSWISSGGTGTVTSVALTAPSIFSVGGSPITAAGTLALTYSGTALPVANGGTGQTSYTDGQLLIGNSTGNTLSKATLTAGSNITITNSAGGITIASTAGGVTSVTGTSPVVSSGGTTPAISMPAATASVNGYLTSTDWNTFNGKGSGTVTSITAGTGLSGGTITSSGTIAIDSTVVTLTGSQTLTNKTLTSPVINEILDTNGNEILSFNPVASATDFISIKNGIGVGAPLHISAAGSSSNVGLHIEPKGTGLVTINDGTDATKGIRFRSSGSTTGAITLLDAVSTAGHVVTLPNATTTLVGRDTTDTLTNKSISGSTNTLSNIGNSSLTNSAITINGTSTSLGGSISVGTVTSVTGTAPVVSSGGATPAISMAAASTTTDGYLTSTDWNTFNSKGSGTVTSVAVTAPSIFSVAGSPITSSGTIALTYSGTALPIANGGTGQTTASAAFNALSPLTTAGDILYGATSGAGTRLGIGTVGQVLTVSIGGLPTWSTMSAGLGTVTSVSVVSANGFAGTVANATTTPDITLTTSITGVLKGNGTAISAATSGTDYSAGTSALATGILKSTTTTGALSIAVAADFPTLNQNTTGSAGSVANALTAGTGLTATATYNGSAAITFNATGTTINSQTTGYTLVAGDAGKTISITTGGVTIPSSVLAAGNIVTIYNNSASSQTITQGSSLTLQWAGQTASSTGNRTLGLYGIATIVFISATNAVITGSGLT